MTGDGKRKETMAEKSKASVTHIECSAMRLLASGDYTQGEIGMMFELGDSTVNRHVNGECRFHSVPSDEYE